MASRKKTPPLVSLPDTVWHAQGLSMQQQAHRTVEQRLKELAGSKTVDAFCHLDHTDEPVPHHVFEARWSLEEGARVHAG
ncbi:hypothetical protein [Streptomyces litmocidini]|uniref:hypothetical protein n=1 Tax=Streptomyces litmocidini TaxID=67318 RepID=UPI003702F030